MGKPTVIRARDLFAGAGGWDVAAERLGWHVDGWEIMREARCTRALAGLKTPGKDVTEVNGADGGYDVEIASPPCQSFSMSGNGSGRRDLEKVLAGVAAYGRGEAHGINDFADPRTALVLEPLRVLLESGAPYAAWEQVPTVLPVWEACADVLRDRGYRVITRVLNAEQYGVPQTRKRAVLMARRDGKRLRFPTPTHSQFHLRDPRKLDDGVLPWVGMAEVFGWDADSYVISNYGTGGDPANRGTRNALEPCATVTSKVDRMKVALRSNFRKKAAVRAIDSPSSTLFFGANSNDAHWLDDNVNEIRKISLEEAAVLQTFPADFPFFGDKGKQFLQVGNAVPPLLAEAILRALVAP